MQRIINNIKRSSGRTKCVTLAFVMLNCFAVSIWIFNPDMWATTPGNNWSVVVAQLTLGIEMGLLLLAGGLLGVFIAMSGD